MSQTLTAVFKNKILNLETDLSMQFLKKLIGQHCVETDLRLTFNKFNTGVRAEYRIHELNNHQFSVYSVASEKLLIIMYTVILVCMN